MPYVGRFAPSPTGPLHAGSLVAALASWLDARAHGGRWLVRIEDVDTPRCIDGAAETLLSQLAACGLVADETPLRQSTRGDRYEGALSRLRRSGWVYPCTCSRGAIAAALARAGAPHVPHGELVYPGTCRPPRWRPAGEHPGRGRAAWRLRTRDAQGHDVEIDWDDRRLGPQHQDVAVDVGDFVLRRADGVWAYQLAVVVDDAEQGVTDIVRGEDLADNTARQIHLQRVLGLSTPRYLHTPLVLAADGQKLSKQTGAQALACATPGEALDALREAGRVLGLPCAVTSRGDGPRLPSEWLGPAVSAWAARYTGDPGSAVHPGVAAQDTRPRR